MRTTILKVLLMSALSGAAHAAPTLPYPMLDWMNGVDPLRLSEAITETDGRAEGRSYYANWASRFYKEARGPALDAAPPLPGRMPVMAIQLAADGRVLGAQVLRSSGVTVYDDLVLELLRGTSAPPVPAVLLSKDGQVELLAAFEQRMRGASVLVRVAHQRPLPFGGPVHTKARLDMSRCTVPSYPAAAARYEQTGTVRLTFEVSAGGSPVSFRVAKSTGYPLLDMAAGEAFMKCPFVPATWSETPVGDRVDVEFRWKLDGPSPWEVLSRFSGPYAHTDVQQVPLVGSSAAPAATVRAVLADIQSQATQKANCPEIAGPVLVSAAPAIAAWQPETTAGVLRSRFEWWATTQCGHPVRHLVALRFKAEEVVFDVRLVDVQAAPAAGREAAAAVPPQEDLR